MKTNELRIGNWIKYTYALSNDIEFCKVTGVKNDGRVYFFRSDGCKISLDANEIEPIKLTETVLLKIGFELVNTKRLTGYEMVKELENNVYEFFVFKIFNNNDTLLNIRKQKGGGFEYGEFIKRGIKYLHQLQNAYYCLTGEDLNIEL